MCILSPLSALCCAGEQFCKKCCSCCESCCQTSMKQQIRLAYILLAIICMLFTIFILYQIQKLVEPFKDYISCPSESGGELVCFGVSAVYRMSFTLAIFFLIIVISLLPKNYCSLAINEGIWLFKICAIILVFFLFFFVSNNFFEGYLEFAKVFGGIYLIFQSIMLIDLFYMWGKSWANKYDKNKNCCTSFLLISTAIILFSATIVFNVYNYILFKGCGLNYFITTFNIVLIVIITIVQLLGYNPHGSLITTGAQSIYMTFLTFSAQISGPDASCNEVFSSQGGLIFELIIAYILTIIVLFYLTLGTKDQSTKVIQINQNNNVNQGLLPSKEDKPQQENIQKYEQQQINDPEKQNQQQNIELKHYQDNQYIIFHIVMFFTSVYSAVLISNWGSPRISQQSTDVYQPSLLSEWIKIIVSWISAFLYIWTLIAPKLFPNREFN